MILGELIQLNAILENNLVHSQGGSFGNSAAFSVSVSATAEDPKPDAIPSTWQASAFGERTVGTVRYMFHVL
jgi:hypothetical protein